MPEQFRAARYQYFRALQELIATEDRCPPADLTPIREQIVRAEAKMAAAFRRLSQMQREEFFQGVR